MIVDPRDDVATIRAIHDLAAREPAVLAVNIAPDSRSSPAVVWAILRALGKRVEYLERTRVKVFWEDAVRWLAAHRIAEMVVLCAQHLRGGTAQELELHATRLRIALTLVYGGRVRTPREATTTLGAFLARPRRPPPAGRVARGWPRVPRSHPLRLRYDCKQRLSPDEFARVDQLLVGSLKTLGAWRWSYGYVTRWQVARVLPVVSAADDPEQAHVRRCGAELALLGAGIPVPRTRPLRLWGRSLTNAQIDAVRAHTSPWVAGYVLAELVTGLPAELLGLIGGDQISEKAILGCPVPERARAVLRALGDRHEPVLAPPAGAVAEPPPATRGDWTSPDRAFAAAVGWILRSPGATVPAGEMPAAVRARFEQLRAEKIVELKRGAYRASAIALYSSYRSTQANAARRDDLQAQHNVYRVSAIALYSSDHTSAQASPGH